MSSLVLSGDVSGTVTLAAPSAAGNTVLTLPSTSGTVITSASTQVAGPAFSAYQSSAQGSISSGVFTKVTFNAEEYDTNSNFASSRFTPTVAGYYQLNSSVRVDGSITRLITTLYKNGAEFKRGVDIAGATPASCVVSTQVYANGSTDYFEIYVYTAGGTPVITSTGVETIYFNGCLVRAA